MYAVFSAYRTPVTWQKNIFEMIFFVDFFVNFMKTYTNKTTNQVVKDWDQIIQNYFDTNFAVDLISLIPLQTIPLAKNGNNIFFVLKIIRMSNIMEFLNPSELMRYLKI